MVSYLVHLDLTFSSPLLFELPSYRPKIQTEPIAQKRVKVWTLKDVDELRGCFEWTDWSEHADLSQDVNETAIVVTGYFCFCE